MSRRKRKGAVDGETAAQESVRTDADVKLDEGLKEFERAKKVGQSVRRKVESFKRRGKISPASIRRLLSELIAVTE